MTKRKEPAVSHVDIDGREWARDHDGTWYSPSHGLGFETFEELSAEYGPLTEVAKIGESE